MLRRMSTCSSVTERMYSKSTQQFGLLRGTFDTEDNNGGNVYSFTRDLLEEAQGER